MNNTHEDKVATRELIDISKKYLRDNFHKFTDFNKIKIALALITKSMPNEVVHGGEIKYTEMGKVDVTRNGIRKELLLHIGN